MTTPTKPLPDSSNAVARDLWWVASSPPLMADVARLPQHNETQQLALQALLRPAVDQLAAMTLEDAMATVGVKGWRVGNYFEALVAYWLRQLPGWRLLAANHPVRQDKRTLGAYDFIVRNAERRAEHWEVAVKFYLLRGDPTDWRNWVGPNQRDRLDKKVNRMRDHQLVLSRREVGRDALQDLEVTDIYQQFVVLKGYFFTEWGTPSTGPVNATRHAEGRWAEVDRIPDLRHAFPDSRWVRRDKPFWLAPLHRVRLESDKGQLPTHVQRPEMWARMSPLPDGSWDEVERWFLLPKHWRDHRA